jgi:transcription initiation factor IIE alpha subunit
MPEYMEEPMDEFTPEKIGEEDEIKAMSIAKLISKRKSSAVIVKWLLNHGSEPHINKEIAEGTNMNVATVGSNLQKLVAIGVVSKITLDTIDKRSHLYAVKRKIGALIVRRYLWLCSWKLIRTLPKNKAEIYITELKNNKAFLDVMDEYNLNFNEAIEALRTNSYVTVTMNYNEPYSVKLKELPLKYSKEEKQVEVGKSEPEEIFED